MGICFDMKLQAGARCSLSARLAFQALMLSSSSRANHNESKSGECLNSQTYKQPIIRSVFTVQMKHLCNKKKDKVIKKEQGCKRCNGGGEKKKSQ